MEAWRKVTRYQDPRTKNWFIRWREHGVDGKSHRRALLCADFSDCCNKQRLKEDEMRSGDGNVPTPQASTLPFYQRFMHQKEHLDNLRPGSLQLKEVALEPYLETAPIIGRITQPHLLAYLHEQMKELGPTTVAMRMREIRGFVNWLSKTQKVFSENPWHNIPLPKVRREPHFATDAQLVLLEKHVEDADVRTMVRMAYLTGMRQGEILQAAWEDIQWVKEKDEDTGAVANRAYLTVWAHTAKTRRSRTIPLRIEVSDLLGTRGTGLIFPGWNKDKLNSKWRYLKERAGIKKLRFHDLRHTFCKLYLQGGGTIADLMAITGHSTIEMMQVYAHFETRYKSQRIDAIRLSDGILEINSTVQIQSTSATLRVIPGDTRAPGVTTVKGGVVKNVARK